MNKAFLCLALTLALSAAEPVFQALNLSGVQNAFRLSERIYCGSAPEGDAGFAALQKLGIKTIITVDGTKPDIELAHKYGMQYIHLPHGYNGISPERQAELIKAAQLAEGPIFVHCHHGKHRGPTAAAIICMAEDHWSPDKGLAWLKEAGTATNYLGLFQTVRTYHAPSDETLEKLPSSFPEVSSIPGLVDAMVAIDGQWDNLKAIRQAGYQPPKHHQDLDPANEAVILWEHFREAQRFDESHKFGEPFLERLKAAETKARHLETQLRQFKANPADFDRAHLDQTFDALGRACASCHKAYRDPALK